MNTESRRAQIVSSLSTKEAREAFVASRIHVRLPMQIREMRVCRGWTQEELGRQVGGMKQARISLCENVDYGSLSLNTLRALAAAFDVGLKVDFVPFSELVDNDAYPPPFGLDAPRYALDARLWDETATLGWPVGERG